MVRIIFDGAVVNVRFCIIKAQSTIVAHRHPSCIFNGAVLQDAACAVGKIIRSAAIVKENKAPETRGRASGVGSKKDWLCGSARCTQGAINLYGACGIKLYCYARVNGERNPAVHNNVLALYNIGASCKIPSGVCRDYTAHNGLSKTSLFLP